MNRSVLEDEFESSMLQINVLSDEAKENAYIIGENINCELRGRFIKSLKKTYMDQRVATIVFEYDRITPSKNQINSTQSLSRNMFVRAPRLSAYNRVSSTIALRTGL